MSLAPTMRGLNTFIADIRACRTREQEEKRVNKELANIRGKFKEGNLTGYDKKKYVCKLLYIYLLGYDIKFGHVEAVNLITSSKYTEKQIGYVAVTLLISEGSDLVRLVINSIKKDLENIHEVNVCLGLQGIANLGGREIAETLTQDVYKCLASSSQSNFVKKKAAVCLLRLFRNHPDVIPVQEWAERIIALLDDYDFGVNVAALCLINDLCSQSPDDFVPAIPKCVKKLYKIIADREYTPDQLYYSVPSPWLQAKILSTLRLFPSFIMEKSILEKLNSCLKAIFSTSNETFKNPQQTNAVNAVLVEAILLAQHIDPESELVSSAMNILVRYISSKETNLRYIGFEMMTPLAVYDGPFQVIRKNQEIILLALKDKDVSVRRRALDLVYAICDSSNAKVIVDELVQYLSVSDYEMREEMLLKIAVLTEKFATDPTWYLDVVLQLIVIAGNQVSNELWFRIVQIVVNSVSMHEYAAKQVLTLLKNPSCNEAAIKVGAYILGEYGDLIANYPQCQPRDQLRAIHQHLNVVTTQTLTIILTTMAKFVNIFPEIEKECLNILKQYENSLDIELQQRSLEYMAIAGREDLLQAIFDQMPPFPERESALIQRLKKNNPANYGILNVSDARSQRKNNTQTMAPGVSSSSAVASSSAQERPQPVKPPLQNAPPASADLLGLGF
ncbi:hypothetical protein MP228_008089 [Amoeboaphelidium protococcarum]|nr:hypothetical protein MP228_008089 [Amoeboaphelidium protococcarum]